MNNLLTFTSGKKANEIIKFKYLILNLLFFLVDDLTTMNNITSLKTLILLNNPLTHIPEFSLSNLENLQLKNVNLTNGKFPKSFENCTKLQSIELSNNNLSTIKSDDLKSLSTLTKLSIENAQLNSIDQDSFTSLSKTLQSLSLLSNSLNSAEFFPTLPNLHSINFDQNKFQQLPLEIIKPGQTKSFFFRNNQINIIDELSPLFYWQKINLSNIEIYLNNNPFDCCQSRWFIRYLTNSKTFVKDSSNLTCASPKIYQGKRLIDLHAELMDCSTGPVYPPKNHLSKIAITFLCIFGLVNFILIVVGTTLYKRYRIRNRFQRRRRPRDYEIVQGDNLPN